MDRNIYRFSNKFDCGRAYSLIDTVQKRTETIYQVKGLKQYWYLDRCCQLEEATAQVFHTCGKSSNPYQMNLLETFCYSY